MKLAITAAATLVSAASLVSVPVQAQQTQQLVAPPSAITRSGALPQAAQKGEARNAAAEGSTAAVTSSAPAQLVSPAAPK